MMEPGPEAARIVVYSLLALFALVFTWVIWRLLWPVYDEPKEVQKVRAQIRRHFWAFWAVWTAATWPALMGLVSAAMYGSGIGEIPGFMARGYRILLMESTWEQRAAVAILWAAWCIFTGCVLPTRSMEQDAVDAELARREG